MGKTPQVAATGLVALVCLLAVAWIFTRAPGLADGTPAAQPSPNRQQRVAASSATTGVVYQTDLANQKREGWSTWRTEKTPSGRPFIGQFNNESVRLGVHSLPAHEVLRVSLTLYVINTWDGIGRISAAGGPCGPDFFHIDVVGGPTLLRTTFSMLPDTGNFAADGKLQGYPWPIPGRTNRGGTGASEVNKLGYIFDYAYAGALPQDAVYPMTFTFAHDQPEVELQLTAFGLQGIDDEGWGISDLKIEALRPHDLSPPADDQLEQLWARLTGDDAVASRDAFERLVLAGDSAVGLVERKISSFGVNADSLRQKIAQGSLALANDVELLAAGPAVEPMLKQQFADRPQVLHAILREIETRPIESSAARRAAAGARLLQMIDSPTARALHERLLLAPPPPPPSPGTPEYDAEWRTRFTAAYGLSPQQTLRYVPRPYPPERERWYLEKHAARRTATGEQPRPITMPEDQYQFVIRTDGDTPAQTAWVSLESTREHTRERAAVPKRGLRPILQSLWLTDGIYAKGPDVLVGLEFDDVALDGDWVIRKAAEQDEALSDLEMILADQLGRNIIFERRKVERDVIVARGNYAFTKLWADQPDDVVLVSQGASHDPNSHIWERRRGEFLKQVGIRCGVPFIDESRGGGGIIKFRFDPSVVVRRVAGRTALDDATLNAMLENLSKQTGLTFTRERRAIDAWVAFEQ
ncbi:MAG TPA: hypothetical protein VGN72_05110 [Tepidisphaeraceae bacterium]|jgi:hypothetical protein|nr:hypothetical protein [Tepidisphaeraceae bacterium]